MQVQEYRNLFEELVKKDLDVFEERRLQDVLLCRPRTHSFSVKDEDFHPLWEHRLTELLDKRQLYLQVSSAAVKHRYLIGRWIVRQHRRHIGARFSKRCR